MNYSLIIAIFVALGLIAVFYWFYRRNKSGNQITNSTSEVPSFPTQNQSRGLGLKYILILAIIAIMILAVWFLFSFVFHKINPISNKPTTTQTATYGNTGTTTYQVPLFPPQSITGSQPPPRAPA